VERFRRASILYGYEILREADRTLLAHGTAEVACLELEHWRPAHLPPDIQRALEGYLAGDQPATGSSG